MNDVQEKARKRIQRLKVGLCGILAMSLIMLVGAFFAYSQGKEINKRIGREDYGVFFWKGVELNEEYSGLVVMAEGRYSTAILYLAGSMIMLLFGMVSIFANRREQQLLNLIEEIKESGSEGH